MKTILQAKIEESKTINEVLDILIKEYDDLDGYYEYENEDRDFIYDAVSTAIFKICNIAGIGNSKFHKKANEISDGHRLSIFIAKRNIVNACNGYKESEELNTLLLLLNVVTSRLC